MEWRLSGGAQKGDERKTNMKNIYSINRALIKMNILDFRTMLGIGPSEVRAPAGGVAHAGGERSGLY